MSILPENDPASNEPERMFDDDFITAHETERPLFTNVHPGKPFELLYGDAEADTAWILVGLAQANAAAACTPKDVAVYCVDERNYFAPVRPDGLDAVEGKTVLIFPKGDAASDHHVFDRSAAFGRFCEDEGAEVRFVWLGADLDAHLGDRDLEQRRKRLQTVVGRTGTKPAKAKPAAPTRTEQKLASERAELEVIASEQGRPVIDVSEDRLKVLNELVDVLKNGRDRDRIFNLGGKLACATTDENGATVAEIVDDELLLNLLARNAQMISTTTKGVSSAWPESKTVSALFGRHNDFRPLRGVAPSPIVRADNTIATEDGYDEAAHVLLDLDGLGLDVPDDPTEEDVKEAVRLLLDEWLGDFPFASAADRANALALILTYPLRELVDLVPLAVISAKSMGTGKSKLLGLIVLLFTRVMPVMDSLPSYEEETRKQFTTLLASGSAFLIFDECPRVGGKSVNRLLTARLWSDRRLGGNDRVALPNRAVMAVTGNNVEVVGDTGRRYYPIELFSEEEHPENRPESAFQHPDIEAWTLENRGRLLTAVFTLIRAWQVAGRPKRTTSFGSFERWEAVVGGVIENAGLTDFLGNLAEHRESVDYDEGLWVAHYEWLAETFPDGAFTTRDALAKMVRPVGNGRVVDPNAELPPEIDGSPLDADYAARLGKVYNRRHGRWSGGYRLGKSDRKAGGNKTRWTIEASSRTLQKPTEAEAAEKAATNVDQSRADGASSGPSSRAPQDRVTSEPRVNDLYALCVAALEHSSDEPETPEQKLARLEVETAALKCSAEERATVRQRLDTAGIALASTWRWAADEVGVRYHG